MTRLLCLCCCLLPTLVLSASAPWRGLDTVGTAQLNFLFWPVYEATLYSPGSFRYPETRPFALALEYKRAFSGSDLVAETGRQWERLGFTDTAGWLSQLAGIFPDVAAGDSITLYVDAQGNSRFYYNEEFLGGIPDQEFSDRFAAIWLSADTSQPGFRRQLLGESP